MHALAVGTVDELTQLAQQVVALKGHVHDMPTWLQTDMAHNEAYIVTRLAALAEEASAQRALLAALHERHQLREALGNAWRLQWVLQNVHALEAGDLFCWITGWTSELTGDTLAVALDRCGARAILHYPPPPRGAMAPLLLANPAWARPFEVFSRALGMPSRNEADPSVVLAVAVPLMFGYMFGDVGQGLVIAAAGVVLRKRFALARLFIVGGVAAAVFGLLFGSVFSLHVLHPLWIAPLDDPLTILLVPLVGGGVLMTTGLALRAVEAHWRGEIVIWLATDAGLIAVYLGLLVCLLWPEGFVVAAAGAAVFCVGHAWHARQWLAALPALGELVERTLQILINTLSFARVGAFALAHAGLSSADRRADGRQRQQRSSQAVMLVVGNVVRHRARRAGRLDPDHAPRAVRVLHPLSRRGGARLPSAAAAPLHLCRRPKMKSSFKFVAASCALALVLALVATVLLVAAPAALAAVTPGGGGVARRRVELRPGSAPRSPTAVGGAGRGLRGGEGRHRRYRRARGEAGTLRAPADLRRTRRRASRSTASSCPS